MSSALCTVEQKQPQQQDNRLKMYNTVYSSVCFYYS